MARTITFNEQQVFDYIFPTTSGGTVFGANKAATTAFNYFSNTAVVNDAIYFGMQYGTSFSDLQFSIGTAVAATTWAVAWERWNGSAWAAVSGLTDNTNGFQNTGTQTVTFPIFTAVSKTVNAMGYLWIRCRITTVTGITNGGANATTVVKNRDQAITISDSGASVSSFNSVLYAADVAGGWGVVTKQGHNQYTYACHIKIGYASDANTTTLLDYDVSMNVKGMIMAKKASCPISMGNLISAPLHSTSLGCYIKFSRDYHCYWTDGTSLEHWYFYSCVVAFTPYVVTRAYNTIFSSSFADYGVDMYNCSFTGGADWIGKSQSAGASVNGIKMMSVTNGPRQEFSDYLRNFLIVGSTYSGYVGTGATNLDYDNTTIDWISDGVGIYWYYTPTDTRARGIYISRQNTVNLTVTAAGAAVQNANITITDTNGYNAAYKQTGYSNGFSYTITTVTTTSGTFAIGDTIRVGAEKLLITAGTNPWTVTRAVEGTTATSNPSTPKIVQKCYPIVATDASGLSGEILVESSLEKWSSGTAPGVTSFTYRSPFTLKIKKYGYQDVLQTMNIQGTSTTSGAVNAAIGLIVDSVIVKSEAAASAITGIAVNHSTQTVTITANTTVRDLYDYIHWDINQGTNPLYATPMTSSDGVNFTLAYNLVLNGGNLTGTGALNLGAKNLTLTSGHSELPITAANGNTAVLTLTGLTTAAVYLMNDAGAMMDYQASVTGTYTYYIPNTATGVWTWVTKKAGYKGAFGTFTATGGGSISAAPSMPQEFQPSGTAMYQGTSDANVTVTFTGSTYAYIVLGNATVGVQAAYDTVERALITQNGMAWLAGAKADTSIAALIAGNFLFMTVGWRLKALAAGQLNTALGAFVFSTDGIPVADGSAGSDTSLSPVAYLSSSQLTSQQVRDAMTLANSVTPVAGSIDLFVKGLYGK